MATNDTAGGPGAHRADGHAPPDPMPTDDATPEVAALQADIDRTRADLAETVDQLAAKLDVKTRVRGALSDARDNASARLRGLRARATDDEGKPTPATLGLGGGVIAAAAAVVVVVLWRRNNSPRRSRRRR
ncbi:MULTISPECIES: DUF3618 domain-containing protein [unclassified Nocardioides]|uniref:DUF3618 domain-containing protein n=1 Tax=unclassified Nocardioides TaxID=2615069 RepID=UPI003605E7BE